jgi:hypothetical protein
MLNLKLDSKQESTLMAALHTHRDYWSEALKHADALNYDLFHEQLLDTLSLIEFIEQEAENG